MFSNISWQDYLVALLIILIIYYGYVFLVYFRKDLLVPVRPDQRQSGDSKEMFREEEENALLFSTVHDLMEELKEVFQAAAEKKFPKEELFLGLQAKLKKYKKLKGTAFQVSVNNHIIKESNE